MGCTSDFKSNDPQTVCDFVSISENENLYAVYGAFSLAFSPTALVALACLRVCSLSVISNYIYLIRFLQDESWAQLITSTEPVLRGIARHCRSGCKGTSIRHPAL